MLNGIPRILIIRLSAIGDVTRVLPALHALRRAHPNAQLDWAVERKSADVLEGHPDIDRVLVFERPPRRREAIKAFWQFCKDIRASRYDIVVDFHGILKSGLISFASAAPERYSFAPPRAQEGSHLFSKKRIALPSQRLSRVEENLLLCKAFVPVSDRIEAIISVPLDVEELVDDYFESTFEGGKRVVAMHVPVDREEKRWPAEHFAELVDLLLADGRFEVLLTYGPGQRDQAQRVAKLARRSAHIAPETPDLKHYAWLVFRSDLYFGCDTGPMHIACAMGTPVVAVFGGTDPAKHGPWRVPSEILYVDDAGGNSDPPNRATAAERLARITAEDAYAACIRIAGFNNLPIVHEDDDEYLD
jgi:lipopolysaccharide heptosyltransferase I